MAKSIVILSGAGISQESGLGTFRDRGGIWEEFDYKELATPEGYAQDPKRVLDFYNLRRSNLLSAQPNLAHEALARLEREYHRRVTIITQNIDDLHERAGSRSVIHIHGELLRAFCAACGHRWDAPEVMNVEDTCPACGQAKARPDVVWFGETPYHMEQIRDLLNSANLFVAIGTSGQVFPAANFVQDAANAGAKTLELNLEPSGTTSAFDEVIIGPATAVVPEWVERILANDFSGNDPHAPPPPMDIYIGKEGQVSGPYYRDEVQKRHGDGRLDGTELAWHEGLSEWENVKDVLEYEASASKADETSPATEPAEEPEPLDEKTLTKVKKIKELIAEGHPNTAWQLIQSLNNPRIYEGLLADCPVEKIDDWVPEVYEDGSIVARVPHDTVMRRLVWKQGRVRVPQYLKGHTALFIKLLDNLPEAAQVKPELKQLTNLSLAGNQVSDVSALAGLKQLTMLDLSDNEITDLTPLAELKELKTLGLKFNRITDLTPLAELTKLESLVLGEFRTKRRSLENPWSGTMRVPETNHITNLKPLTGLKNLRHLTVYLLNDFGVSKSEVDMLAAALPQCSIVEVPTSYQLSDFLHSGD